MTRRFWFVVLVLVATVLVVVVSGLTFLRARVASSRLPERFRSVEILRDCPATVDVLFDQSGYPHVFSGDDSALWYAQGYLHARDRFFQMDLARRAAAGRLAEVFGQAMLTHDRKARTLRLASSARRQAALLSERDRRVLDDYTAGVNAAIDRFGRWIAPEVWLLDFPPQRWSIEDSLAIGLLAQLDLSRAMGSEMRRALQLSRLGRERAVDLWGWSPAEARQWIPPIDGVRQPVRSDEAITLPGGGFGTNAWAVAPNRTLSGRPLLANDPHLGVQLPASFFAIHLRGPRLDVSGASIPGMPGVVIGHTSGVAWGLALSMLDDQDFYRLTVDDLGSRELVDGAWQPLRTVTENIAVRWQDEPVLLKVRLSVHGPVVREQRDEALAVAWTGLHGPTVLQAVLAMNRAATVSEVASAWTGVISPSLCIVAADTTGNILHQVVGQAPVRGRGAGRLPAPGSDSAWAWKGFRPATDNARRLNPSEGFAVAANQDLFGEGLFPSAASFPGEFEPPWRARRISAALSASDDWTVSSTEALQRDDVSARAIALLKLLRVDLQEQGGAAVDELLAWDGDMRATSHGATLFAELLSHLEEQIGQDEVQRFSLTENPIGPEEILRLLAGGLDPRWWDDARGSTKRSPAEVVRAAVSDLEDGRRRVQWGDVHQVVFNHPLASLPGIGRLLSDTWSRGPFPSDGGGATVNAQNWERSRPFRVTTIPALRFVADVGNWDATVLGLPLGQSGRPWSRHYDDQIAEWRHGHSAVMPFSREAVRKAASASLRLETREPRATAAVGRE